MQVINLAAISKTNFFKLQNLFCDYVLRHFPTRPALDVTWNNHETCNSDEDADPQKQFTLKGSAIWPYSTGNRCNGDTWHNETTFFFFNSVVVLSAKAILSFMLYLKNECYHKWLVSKIHWKLNWMIIFWFINP